MFRCFILLTCRIKGLQWKLGSVCYTSDHTFTTNANQHRKKQLEPCCWSWEKPGHVEGTGPPHPHQQLSAFGHMCRESLITDKSQTKQFHLHELQQNTKPVKLLQALYGNGLSQKRIAAIKRLKGLTKLHQLGCQPMPKIQRLRLGGQSWTLTLSGKDLFF